MKLRVESVKCRVAAVAVLMFGLCAELSAALPLPWRADWPNCKPVEKLVHRGSDVALQPTFYINGLAADTNGWTFSTFVQTNAVGAWFGPLPGAFFSHTNDVGASFYNVMVRAETPDGNVNYTAFARFRMLDSPGFTPGELPLPAKVIDFADVTVLNPPWGEGGGDFTTNNTVLVETIEAVAPTPGNYAAVSNAAMNARDKTDLALYKKAGVGETWTLVSQDGTITTTATGVFSNGSWSFYVGSENVAGASTYYAESDYQVDWVGAPEIGYAGTATRPFAYQPVTGDALATSHGLASVAQAGTNYTDSAISSADTSYLRFTTPTNLNQSVQYLTTAPGGVLSIELPTNGETKDWIVYAYFGSDTPLALPAANWWMADEAYTNAIPADTPTAFYFSQVAAGIFTLSRQELITITVTTP